MKPLPECRLYAFVDTAYLRGRAPEAVAQQLCEGGADLLQLRAKGSSAEEVRRMAEAVLPIARAAGVGLVINDHLEIAQQVGADFCHLGQEDFSATGYPECSPLRTRREGCPPSLLRVGLSTHSPDQARKAMAAGADYLGVGPVYATGTKPQATPVTLDYVRWAAANVAIPWFAIGGINLANLDQVLAAGAQRVCVVSAILNADDTTAACRALRQRLTQ